MKVMVGIRVCDICLITGKVELAIYKSWNPNGAREIMIDVCDKHKDFIRDLSPAELNNKMKAFTETEGKPLTQEQFNQEISKHINIKPGGSLLN